MATLRNLAISLLRLAGWTNLAHALRHHAADNRRPWHSSRRDQRLCRGPESAAGVVKLKNRGGSASSRASKICFCRGVVAER